MSKTLVEHAAFELTKAGLVDHEDPEARKTATDTMSLVRRFVKQNHTQTTAKYVLQFFEDICNFLPITAVSDDPAEWKEFEIKTTDKETGKETVITRWECTRAPAFISEDGGKTFTDMKTGQTQNSVDHVKMAQRAAEEAKKAEAAKAETPDKAEKPAEAPESTEVTKPEKEKSDGEVDPPAKS